MNIALTVGFAELFGSETKTDSTARPLDSRWMILDCPVRSPNGRERQGFGWNQLSTNA
jgi:hypothetical protein